MAIFTTVFRTLAKAQAGGNEMPDLPTAIMSHPVDGIPPQEVQKKVEAVIGDIIYGVTKWENGVIKEAGEKKTIDEIERIAGKDLFDAAEKMNRLFLQRGWGNGFPLIPPTRERVDWMLKGTDRSPEEVVGIVRPKGGKATVQKIAVNAAMAGCLPSYMPVILTAVEAMTDPAFALAQVAATAGSSAPLLIINGPIRRALRINYGTGALGTAWRANATIGAAIRLIMVNIGGTLPGLTDMSVIAWPGDFTLCMAENEEANPWEPLHVERGFDRQTSTVTTIGTYGILDLMASTDKAKEVLGYYATMIIGSGSVFTKSQGTLLLLSPEVAGVVAKEGWSKQDVKKYLFEVVHLPLDKARDMATGGMGGFNMVKELPRWGKDLPDDYQIHLLSRPEDVNIVVVGGASVHTAWAQPGHGRMVTREIRLPANWEEILERDKEAIESSMPGWLK